MSLKEYQRKRKFESTPEPRGVGRKGSRASVRAPLRFVVQMHAATRLHFDLRLEMGGVFKSWAVPKGPSLNPQDQRLAVFVEDHPLEYGSFEGVIPRGNYGAGTVMVWDQGTYQERGYEGRAKEEAAMLKGLENGHLTFVLEGRKLRGEFALIKLKKSPDEKAWLLVKKRDEHSTYKGLRRDDTSVKTGRTIEEIAAESEEKGEVWIPKRTKTAPRARPPTQAASPVVRRAAIPRRVKAMLPIQSREAVDRKGWIHEPFAGGTRAMGEVEKGRVKLYSRQLLPFEKKYPAIVSALAQAGHDLVIDGEIVEEGPRASIYRVFDLLYLDGRDLRDEPLVERQRALRRLRIFGGPIVLNDKGDFPEVLARDGQSLYRSGISHEWVRFARKPVETEEKLALTHLDKIYWPEEGYTKGDLIEYYRAVAPVILPHLRDRPESLNRHPEGIHHPGFFQKNMTGYLPRWIRTERIYSGSGGKSIDYFLCQDERSLLYLANLGCIELNPWLSRVSSLDRPDFAIIDLDPDDNPFSEVVEVAQAVREVLDEIRVEGFCKTSGASGIHIAVPTGAQYAYDEVRDFAEAICKVVHARLPKITSLERNPAKRRHKIYLDFMQNRRGQTLAAPYCIRPRPGATVSTPIRWRELGPRLDPGQFTIRTVLKRIKKVGDLWKGTLTGALDLEATRRTLERIS